MTFNYYADMSNRSIDVVFRIEAMHFMVLHLFARTFNREVEKLVFYFPPVQLGNVIVIFLQKFRPDSRNFLQNSHHFFYLSANNHSANF